MMASVAALPSWVQISTCVTQQAVASFSGAPSLILFTRRVAAQYCRYYKEGGGPRARLVWAGCAVWTLVAMVLLGLEKVDESSSNITASQSLLEVYGPG
jgi:hypothetical protein